jgi:hypothetical protein
LISIFDFHSILDAVTSVAMYEGALEREFLSLKMSGLKKCRSVKEV